MNCNSALIHPSTNNIIQFPSDNSAIKKRQDMYDDQLIDKENRWNNDADCLIYSLEDLEPKTLQSFKEPFAKLYIMLITLSNKYNEFHEKKCNSEATSKCGKWKQYRLGDCIDVCAQEAERIVQCLENIPEKELLSNKPLMELEQQFGIWQPYISDNDSDDEDWKEDPKLLSCVEYIYDRGFTIDDYNWHWSAEPGYADRVIIPFYHEGKIAGWTGRRVTDGKNRYLTSSQPGYVFNIDRQTYDRKYLIVVEGQFDAIAVDGVGILHNDPNAVQ